jgi:hypothetical protein
MIDLFRQRPHDRHNRSLILCAAGRDERAIAAQRRTKTERLSGAIKLAALRRRLNFIVGGMKRRDSFRRVRRVADDLSVSEHDLPASVPGHRLIVGH